MLVDQLGTGGLLRVEALVASLGMVLWPSSGGAPLGQKLRRESSMRRNRNVDQNEVARWIEVVLAGLVDDTEIAILPSSGVWKNRVDLAHLEIDAVVISQTDRKPIPWASYQ